jgi:aspartyl-tRNA(Asn)/glutamyl-tRNA(Gln) amidotransferase subunit A
MAMSLDQIGPLTNSVEDAKLIFDIIKGQDNFDSVTKEFTDAKRKKKYKIGLVNVEKFANKEIADLISKQTKKLAKENNWEIKEVHLPLDIATQTYYVLVYVEFFSATRKYDGRRFGKKIEESAGPEVLRRILGGSEISQAEYAGKYYREALKAKKFIQEQFEKLFEEVDIFIMPTVPRTAHKVGEQISVEEMYGYDVLTVLANLAGLPAISIPVGEIEKKAVGLQILAPHFQEEIIFDVGSKLS